MNKLPSELQQQLPPEPYLEDDPSKEFNLWMQNTDTIDAIQRLEIIEDSELLDEIAQADWAQVPEEQLDIPVSIIVGKTEGELRNCELIELDTRSGKIIAYRVPMQTQFVRVTLIDGQDVMEAFDVDRHGPWQDIRDIGITPAELLEQLWGFGDSERNQGWQFQLTRKCGSSRKYWPIGHFPSPIDRTPKDI
jgi:hypothetical protein